MPKLPTVSRRKFLGTAAATGLAAAANPATVVVSGQGLQPATQALPAGVPAPDLTLVNGRIHTMDARNTIATSVTIRNGRFATIGAGAAPRSPAGQVIDLRGRTVVPGLIEGHIHSVSLA